MTRDALSEMSREERRRRLQEREEVVKELTEQLEREKGRLDETWEELETLPRAVLWQPLRGRIELLETRVAQLERDLAAARLAVFEEDEAQARGAYKRAAARAARARQLETEAWRVLQAFEGQVEEGEGGAGVLEELDSIYEKAQALVRELEQAEGRAMDALNVAERRREELEQDLGDLLR